MPLPAAPCCKNSCTASIQPSAMAATRGLGSIRPSVSTCSKLQHPAQLYSVSPPWFRTHTLSGFQISFFARAGSLFLQIPVSDLARESGRAPTKGLLLWEQQRRGQTDDLVVVGRWERSPRAEGGGMRACGWSRGSTTQHLLFLAPKKKVGRRRESDGRARENGIRGTISD
ncbi:hypothetical protein VTI74DRAFT_8939 [Chaetomium olivicolor]